MRSLPSFSSALPDALTADGETPAWERRRGGLGQRTLLLLVAFLVAVIVFAGYSQVNSYGELRYAIAVHRWTRATADISEAMHQLQLERGLSSGYLVSGSSCFAQAREHQLAKTDSALAHLNKVLETLKAESPAGFPAAVVSFNGLDELRALVEQRRISHDAAVQRYTTWIEKLMALLLSRVDSSGRMAAPQLALISFLRAKEAAGQERALVTALLSSGDFGHFSRIATYHRLRTIESTYLNQFYLLAHEDLRAQQGRIEASGFAQELDAIRRRIVAIGHSAAQPQIQMAISPERWFELASQRVDAMKAIEDELVASIVNQSAEMEGKARRWLVFNVVSALVAFLLAGLLIRQMLRNNKETEADLHLADKVFNSSVEAIVVTSAALRIVEVNPAFCRISGYSRDELIGRNIGELKSGRHEADFYAGMWQQLERDGNWEGEVWNRRRNGDIYPALLSIVAVRNQSGSAVSNYIAMSVDLSQRKKVEELLERLRTFDALTGLLSRDAWRTVIDQVAVQARGTRRRFAVLKIGLDRFKLINDSLNHAVGDEVLLLSAERIRQTVRRHDAVARPGGDLFAVLLDDIGSAQGVGAVCEKLLAAFRSPMTVGEHQLHVSVSIGVAIFPNDGEETAMLERNAESAMYRAKEEGRAGYRFYSAEMSVQGVRLLALEGLLRQALANGEFKVYYQPQVDVLNNRLLGVEALLRWHSPELGSVSPVQFIPVAEETGLIVPIGEWVLREACRQMRAWLDEFGNEMTVAVNLSGRQFRQSDLLPMIGEALAKTALPAHLLELEITEGALIADSGGAVEVLRGLRELGVRTAIDDFGTGYSSLAYLKTFPLDRLKIDRAFIRDLPHDESDTAILRAIVALGRNLHLEVLAEGVETQEQQAFLADIGCQVLQGYLHGRPMSAEALTRRLRDGSLHFS
ncbi:MAG: EAL domain-containing protein [Azonexus sp.]|jgi:diguanylate cyclase (GGDEF)-like protein/PAS domain S-box-containing protein|uniref:EAL domain-containing protein n=1 Tax=Azonexus sp. TaxID=1872668 RepID=UPI002822BE64|nr:EAL domain-containing protein [Azonexus sp.]MDR0776982.1 EAL domain-containing protein [Azonexus sp.]